MANDIKSNDISRWMREVFRLPGSASLKITEHYGDCASAEIETRITIQIGSANSYDYSIMKPASAVCYEDIVILKDTAEQFAATTHPLLSKIFRYFGWWFIFAGGLTTFSVCPLCGQIGCPVGIGTTGIIAGVFAILKQNGSYWFHRVKHKLFG